MSKHEIPLAVVSHALFGAWIVSNNSEINRGGNVSFICPNFDTSKNAVNDLGLGVEQVNNLQLSSATHWGWGARQQEGGEAFAQSLFSLKSVAQRGAKK